MEEEITTLPKPKLRRSHSRRVLASYWANETISHAPGESEGETHRFVRVPIAAAATTSSPTSPAGCATTEG